MATKAAQALPATPKSGGRAYDDRPHVADGQAQDFSDPESQRVLAAAARGVARELGRQAAREYFAELIGQKDSK
jgi:hypothetical protein